MAYDRMDWHYGGQFPQGLPHEAGGIHIGMYMAWAFSRGMASDELREEAADELALLAQRAITGRDVLINCCDEKFWAEDLTPEGQAFTQAYYGGESAFAAAHSTYLDDYCAVFNADAERQGFEYASIYHVANTWANFDLLAPRLDARLAQWHAWCADPAHAQAAPPVAVRPGLRADRQRPGAARLQAQQAWQRAEAAPAWARHRAVPAPGTGSPGQRNPHARATVCLGDQQARQGLATNRARGRAHRALSGHLPV